jgi:hypothetical protein
MQVVLYQSAYNTSDQLDQFLDIYLYKQMPYFASDLLEGGLSPNQITQAVSRAMLAGETAGISVRRHFIPVYTQHRKGLIKDCKLSKLGYALVLLNAEVSNPIVAKWQMQVLEQYLD